MPRSGSTFYTDYLANKNKVLNLGEFFSPGKKIRTNVCCKLRDFLCKCDCPHCADYHADIVVSPIDQRFDPVHGNKPMPTKSVISIVKQTVATGSNCTCKHCDCHKWLELDQDTIIEQGLFERGDWNMEAFQDIPDEFRDNFTLSDEDHMDKLEYCQNNKNSVVKVFPWHIKTLLTESPQPAFLEHSVHRLTDEKHFLIRRDLNSQIKSYYLAFTSSTWHGTPQEHEEVTVNEEMWDKIYHHYIQGYTVLADWYNKSPDATLIDYSELPFHTSTNERYVRPVTWITEPPQYDIDIREFFV